MNYSYVRGHAQVLRIGFHPHRPSHGVEQYYFLKDGKVSKMYDTVEEAYEDLDAKKIKFTSREVYSTIQTVVDDNSVVDEGDIDESNYTEEQKAVKNLSLASLTHIAREINGDDKTPAKFKDKSKAIEAIGKAGKQKIVRAMLLNGGTTVLEVQDMFKISKAYARDIIAKIQAKGEAVVKDGDTFKIEEKAA